ncbi:MAG: class I SAM-dependent methyltransferase [Acidimicrobiia bacterium]|nr:class I SAM-dependent methyltransferase [Acidimicrobiia bacterium]
MEAEDWDDRYGGDELVWSAEPNQFVAAHLSDLAPGDAIDLAAGEGRNAVWLASRGWRVTAVDFSSVALAKARQRAEANGVELDLREADLRQWNPEPDSVDLALIAYLQLPHAQQRQIVAAAGRAVRPGGTFFLVAHDRSNIERGHGGPQDPSVLPDVELVTGALQGFDIERAEVVTRQVDTDDGPRQALDTLVSARRPG